MPRPQPLNPKEHRTLLDILEARFSAHPERHQGHSWETVRQRLEENLSALRALREMEQTGGEPDVVGPPATTGAVQFIDCAAESPSGRRSLCYDAAALASRKENKPRASAVALAGAMGIELLTEAQYRELQAWGEFDRKTSSWIATPDSVRQLGGALFCDRRYGAVFTYHNGAESYYAARGFRGRLVV